MASRLTSSFTFKIFILFAVLPALIACGWDWDTIKMEKKAFPSIHELITGKFIRHSPEFYAWRIKDRTKKLKSFPDSLALLDDLGWAYDKLGQHQKAISIFIHKDSLKPNQYKTYANLGTCLIHNGQLAEGVDYIKKAIAINPEAHFGREVYQQHVVEYLLSKSDSTGSFELPLCKSAAKNASNFYTYLKQHQFKNSKEPRDVQIAKAIKGIAGMMHFGNYNSPILLECLGDLLTNSQVGDYAGAEHLAARAYIKASLITKDPTIKKAYRKKAEKVQPYVYSPRPNAIEKPHPLIGIKGLKAILKLEIQAANEWFSTVRERELNWVANSSNPDSAFAATYYETPSQKDVHQYQYSSRLDEIDDSYWLKAQLSSPASLRESFVLSLNDSSLQQELDSLYQEELLTIISPKAENPPIVMQNAIPRWVFVVMMSAGAILIVLGIRQNFLRRKKLKG